LLKKTLSFCMSYKDIYLIVVTLSSLSSTEAYVSCIILHLDVIGRDRTECIWDDKPTPL
jgi:hypothetical protein